MNEKIEKAIFDLEKVDALMYAIENSCLDLDVFPGSKKAYDKGVVAFYALWDAIDRVADDLETLEHGKNETDTPEQI